ncbi:hypothetical protein [Shewanella sp. MBTL60-007]|uniref:hypothetical protein n=1 Tax=Shewanella sp. MBTL60-007 TaxID=2815911 RepID=UPI001BB891BD|nr:hypothetical protein [Shewanella sp. MBTL60-007]GIU12574.1 hypothetical protein TUM3792_01290 [Shewanella sp. MBTL60-007]
MKTVNKKLNSEVYKNTYIKRLLLVLFIVPALLVSSVTISTFNAYADPDPAGHTRCAVLGPGADFNLRAVIQDNNIDPMTPIGQVLTTIEMEGGAWNFNCAPSTTGNDRLYIGAHGFGGWQAAPSPNSDATVCAIPGLSGIGIRLYQPDGNKKNCYTNIYSPRHLFVIDDDDNFGSASFSPLAELVRVGNITAGYHTLSNMTLSTMVAQSNVVDVRHGTFNLVFTNPILEAHLCTMVQFNETIDFGSAIARGDEVISKPFDVWLTDCSGAALTEYKNSAELTFASSPGRISPDGTRLHNCDDDDCADGAYITFTDIEGDAVNLKTGYRLNAQTTDNDYKLSFSSNLHTENTTGGKIDTSLTLVINYL